MPYAQLKQFKKMKYIPVRNTGQNRGRSPTCGVANLGFPKLSLVLFYQRKMVDYLLH